MGPANGVVGDQFGTELPQTEVPAADLSREKDMARFSKSKEFAALKSAIEAKIEFYQGFIPGANGSAISVQDLPNEERGWRWLAADNIISEFKSILTAYEQAAEAVKNESAD